MDTASSLACSPVHLGKESSQKACHLQPLPQDLPGRSRSSLNITKKVAFHDISYACTYNLKCCAIHFKAKVLKRRTL